MRLKTPYKRGGMADVQLLSNDNEETLPKEGHLVSFSINQNDAEDSRYS